MEREKFEEVVLKLNYEKNKWMIFHEIESILLTSGRGIYPDWKYQKFLINDKNQILIQHGKVKPYGARIANPNMISSDFTALYFTLSKNGIPIESSSLYNEWFRQPKTGDAIRVTDGMSVTHGESYIKEVIYTMNSIVVYLWSPLNFPSGRLSFYDPSVLGSDKDNCIHSSITEGIYMQFVPNIGKSKHKNAYFHEIISFKDIKEINLRVGKEYFNKTYKLE